MSINAPVSLGSFVLENISRLHFQLRTSYNTGDIASIVTRTEFTAIVQAMPETQLNAICHLIKSIMTRTTITSLELSYCSLVDNEVTDLIQLMKQFGLKLELGYLSLIGNHISNLACIYEIGGAFDDCKLYMQSNELQENQFGACIRGVSEVNLIGNGISKRTILPEFKSNRGWLF
ncbi:Hypothetical protein MVR_LOCUS402 [uncultured virus]|nr:Hypothetical protein MVR_LOCUS402 [uncultured virus]